MPPHVPGLDVAAAFRPAGTGTEIGGDFYDVFQIAQDDWFAVLGDVCGKGPDAAVITALLRYAVRAAAMTTPDPAAVLRITNDVLRGHDTERFCTALLVRLQRDGNGWLATICAAGHPLPLLVPPGGPARLAGEPGSLLGVMPSLDLPATTLELTAGARLLLYTDGVTEARRAREEYGDERLLTCAGAAAAGAASLVGAVREDVLAFQYGVPRDDNALLALTPA